ncbi:MAG: methyltransferase domain-containing protein [Caldilineaceae bacterium]
MPRRLASVTLVVHDYDEAINFFTGALRFRLLEDTRLSEEKRWVVVSPGDGGSTSLLLARAANETQNAHVGQQTGGRVAFFLHTDDFWDDYAHMKAHGVHFTEEPRQEEYGTVVVFLDLYGNKWDLVQRNQQKAVHQDETVQQESRYERLSSFYQSGPVPWDHVDPPPEVLATVPTLPVGRALDLGSGLGRASIFMGKLGWQVDGVDFIPQAIEESTARAKAAGVADRVHFHQSEVTELGFLDGPYDYALDVGCAHSFSVDELRAYHRHLRRLLRPGAIYMLFAHLNEGEVQPDQRRWMDEADVRAVFADGFSLRRAEYGTTQVGDQAPWRSAWFWFERV